MLRGPFTVPRVAPSGEFPSGGGGWGRGVSTGNRPRTSSKAGDDTSGTSWVKRTTQGHFKCRGRSRMERRLFVFVKLHKYSSQKSLFFGCGTCPKAELPILMRLYCNIALYHTFPVLSRGFYEIFCVFFGLIKIDKNEPAPRRRPSPPFRGASGGLPPRSFLLFYAYFQKIREILFTNS